MCPEYYAGRIRLLRGLQGSLTAQSLGFRVYRVQGLGFRGFRA